MGIKRILTIQDLSCVGRCSMTVALPILSLCGHEACALPTALLSTHTGGFGRPAVVHFDQALPDIWRHWQENGITFDAILVGYLGSTAAVQATEEIRQRLLAPGGVCIVDPAMADNGKLYAGFDHRYVQAVAHLCEMADILLPNPTEAALLGDVECPCTILTGVDAGAGKLAVVLREEGRERRYVHERIGGSFHGTGDLFAACFTGALLRGMDKFAAMKTAADFVCRAIEATAGGQKAQTFGVCFEPVLPELAAMLERG